MIIGLFGSVGSGKTTDALKFMEMLYKRGYKIFTNLEITGIETTLISLDDLLDIVEHGHIVNCPECYILDEIILLGLDSRNGGKVSKILGYLMLQNRKLSYNEKTHPTYFIYTTQYPDLIDKRLWITTEIKISHFKVELRDLTVVVRYWFIKKMFKKYSRVDWFIANPYFKYFDTKQIVRLSKTERYDKPQYKKRLIKQKSLITYESDEYD